MKALFVTHSFPREPGDPVGSFVLRLAVLLREQGITVNVVAPSAPGLMASDVIEGIVVDRFRYAPARLETLAYTGTMIPQVQSSKIALAALGGMVAAGIAKVASVAHREEVDLVHAHWWFPSGLSAGIAWGARHHPQITTLHGSDMKAADVSASAMTAFRFVMHNSRVVTAVSSWLAEEAQARAPGVCPEVAPMPVDSALFHPTDGERPRDRLLFIGKLNEQKGISPLLKALSLMHHRPELDIVVGPGSEEGPMRKLAFDLELSSQIRWHSMMPQADLAALYRDCTCLVAPMIGEGLGLIAVEAALSGLPVVAADSGGLRDVVVPDVTGMLVPPSDPAALSLALDALLSLDDQGAALGATARARALATFSAEAVAKRYAEIYRRALTSE